MRGSGRRGAAALTATTPSPEETDARPAVRARGIRKGFGGPLAVDRVDLDLVPGEILALLGPSGCGKTTLLRVVAGLTRPDAGTVEIAGTLVEGPDVSVAPERRGVGMVFQDVALFPHHTVAGNIAYGIAREPGRERRVTELLELIGLPGAGGLRPHELSGGMAQRVALARALAPRPHVILLDEPFGSLDAGLRIPLREDVRRILQASGTSALFVTHDQAEALTLADRVAVMRAGRIEQVGTPERIYGEPASPFVATFVGVANLVPGHVQGTEAATALGCVRLLPPAGAGPALVVVRPEHLDLEPFAGHVGEGRGEGGAPGGRTGRVTERRFAGSELLFAVEVDGGPGRLWVEAGPSARQIAIGDPVRLTLRPVESVAFPDQG